MSHKQFTPVKKDDQQALTSLFRFLTTEQVAKEFETNLAKNGEKASKVLRNFVEDYNHKNK